MEKFDSLIKTFTTWVKLQIDTFHQSIDSNTNGIEQFNTRFFDWFALLTQEGQRLLDIHTKTRDEQFYLARKLQEITEEGMVALKKNCTRKL